MNKGLRRKHFAIECLESRRLLAGECHATLESGSLLIECDDQDNQLVVTQVAAGTIKIEGQFGTTVNGAADDTISGVTEDVRVRLADGNDSFRADGLTVSGRLVIHGGAGSDFSTIDNTTVGKKFFAGKLDDLRLRDSVVGESVILAAKGDGQSASIERTSVGGNVIYLGRGDGSRSLGLESVEVAADVLVHNGYSGTSRVSIVDQSVVNGDVEVQTQGGTFELFESQVGDDVDLENRSGDASTNLRGSQIGDDLTVKNGLGFSNFDMRAGAGPMIVGGEVKLDNGSGGSRTAIIGPDVRIHKDLTVENQDGFDLLFLFDVIVDETVQIKHGHGGSSNEIRDSVFDEFGFESKSGTDVVELTRVSVDDDTKIELGGGDDELSVEQSVFKDDFFADGGCGVDVFVDLGGNLFCDDAELKNFEVGDITESDCCGDDEEDDDD